MQFSIMTTLMVLAAGLTGTNALAIKRQSSVGTAQPAMTDANGNVVPFVASQVYKAATENGLQ